MPRGGSNPGERRGGRKEGTLNKRTIEVEEAAKNALVNVERKLLDDPNIFLVVRRLGKERMTEVEEMAMEEVLRYREAARAGDVAAREQFYRYLSLVLEAAARRAPYESPRLAAVAVQEKRDEHRVITGDSARERLLQVVLALIAAEDAEAARAEKAVDVTPPRESHTEAETVVTPPEPDDDCDGELA